MTASWKNWADVLPREPGKCSSRQRKEELNRTIVFFGLDSFLSIGSVQRGDINWKLNLLRKFLQFVQLHYCAVGLFHRMLKRRWFCSKFFFFFFFSKRKCSNLQGFGLSVARVRWMKVSLSSSEHMSIKYFISRKLKSSPRKKFFIFIPFKPEFWLTFWKWHFSVKCNK